MDIGLIGILFGYLVIMFGLSYGFVLLVKGDSKKLNRIINTFIVVVYITSWVVFLVGFSENSYQYNVPIDPIDNGYTPLSKNHLFSFIVFFSLSLIGIYKIWKLGKKQPPLMLVFYISSLIIGIVLNVFLAIQLSPRHDGDYYYYNSFIQIMPIAPIIHVLVSLILLVNLIKEESLISEKREFKNRFLNQLNIRIQNSKMLPLWTLIALLPIYIIITLILVLFGQEYDSLTKVFTETSTWHFSQETHPPYLDHQGHYLCTVAACGTPNVVKPLRLGIRNGEEIIVNRQLLIANAFEDIIMTKYPRAHKMIRRNYDKYGYPLSKDINSKLKSNVTYIAMKPLEWIFLIFIYSFSERPEKLIDEQYNINPSRRVKT